MAKRNFIKAVMTFPIFITRCISRITKSFILWLLRALMFIGRQPRAVQQGFVLPTTILLLLVLTLTVGAITLRTLDRTAEATGDRQTQVIYNVATPAIDRAKSKLEFMFNRQRDPRIPTGVPGEEQLVGMLVNDGRARNGLTVPQFLITNDSNIDVDPYTFPDEEFTASTILGLSNDMDVDGNDRADRLDLDGDNLPDNAWAYRVDMNEDGTDDATVAYSIILQTPANPADMVQASDAAIANRANALQVRHGPLSSNADLSAACQVGDAGVAPIEGGWFRDRNNSALLRKNFQINAFVLPDALNGTVATLEFHQDRQLAQGNKWGAWFRNDLEIFPGPQFNWNGAMHTEGSMMVGNGRFTGYLVSSPASCLYTREASEVTITEISANADQNIPAFQGQILSAKTNNNSFNGGDVSRFHLHDTTPIINGDDNIRLDRDRDSVTNTSGTPRPIDYALDPIALFTRDVSQARGTADPSAFRAGDWNDTDKKFVSEGRIYNQQEDAPYLDDFYRADNRYGPKPRYAGREIPVNIGGPIAGNLMAADGLTDNDLINDNATEPFDVGLDGYWERRARREGLSLIVGQRLEIGDASGWGYDLNQDGELSNTDGDSNGIADERQVEPIYPPDQCLGSRCHEHLQRRTLYDNLAAVQSLAVYHSASGNNEFPAACYALTAHPGTTETIRTSRQFNTVTIGATSTIQTDFLNGQGTNGWEFDPPATSEPAFANAIASDQPLGIALRNLAHFSGDPLGGAPSFTPVQETGANAVVHPYPNLTMWGDYSMLRRVLAMLDGGTAAEGNPTGGTVAYANLSPADKATLHTAACTIRMLAYNLDVNQRRYEALYGSSLSNFGQALWELIDGEPSNGEVNTLISPSVNFPGGYNRDTDSADFYGQFTTKDFIEALKNKTTGTTFTDAEIDEYSAIIPAANQVQRDRLMGFADGGYAVAPATSSRIDWSPGSEVFTESISGSTITRTVLDESFDDSSQFTVTQGSLFVDGNGRDFFTLTDGSTIANEINISGMTGQFLAAQDTDDNGTKPATVQIQWDNLDITNLTEFTFSGLFAEDDAADNNEDWDNNSSVRLEYSVDGGAFQSLLAFESTGNSNNRAPLEDTDFNGQGDGTELTDIAQAFTKEFTVNGSLLDLRLTIANLNGGDEDIAIDSLNLTGTDGGETITLRSTCDPDLFATPANTAIIGSSADERDKRKIGLAAAFCSPSDISFSQPKYPSLYYLFPFVNHDHDGNDDGGDDNSTQNIIEVNHTQPSNEEYISDDTYIYDAVNSTGVNFGFDYGIVDTRAIALTPHSVDYSNWVLPTVGVTDSTTQNVITANGTNRAIPLLDTGMYNGREMIGVRVLDIDWDMLHSNSRSLGNDGNSNQDHWLPNSAVVYAVREDAVREDGINRPTRTGIAWGNCNQDATYATTGGPNNSNCRMDGNPQDPHDPPLFDQNLISPKSVDYYPDPMRRPNGFRLRNGSELWRNNDNGRGLSFISDNPVYIRGDFNLHQTTGCNGAENCRLEEFTQKLPTNGTYNTAQFYDNRTELDLRFASPATDLWRPTEVLADAVSILSDDYCDGSIEDSFVTAGNGSGANISDSEIRYSCSGNEDRTSYLDQNRPNQNIGGDGFSWLRVNPDDSTSPIIITRNGMPMMAQGSSVEPYDDEYNADDFYNFNDGKPLIRAATTRVNAIIISGLVPSRVNQAYGGMHNFPRFLERWSRLYISGGLLQLNFSNYATAPFDQDAWETDENTQGRETIPYYSPPNRLWGYDVALQYSPAGPIAARFITPQTVRSEFYSEPNADDQYMINLCRQIAPNPAAQCG